MTGTLPIRTLQLLAVLAMLPATRAAAQYPGYEPPRWRINGFAGFSITHTSEQLTNQVGGADQLFPLGELRVNSDGFLLDPKFLHINAGIDYQKGANQSDRGDLGNGGTNLAISSVFLPNSHLPLRASYTRTNHGISGLGMDQNTDNSRLDIQWNVFHPRLPHIVTSFQNYGSTVHVPTSFSDQSFHEKSFSLGLSDNWKAWNWSGGFSMGNGDSTGGFTQQGLNSTFSSSSRAGDLHVSRSFWENKARLLFENRDVWRKDHLGGDGTSTSDEITNSLTFDVQVNPKVSWGAGYAFNQTNFEGNGLANVFVPGAGQTQLVALISSNSNNASGHVDYHPLSWLRFIQEIHTTLSSPASGVVESRTSFTESDSTVSADHHWRSFDVMGSYTGRYQITGTTLDRSPTAWSNSFLGRMGWGDAKHVRVILSGQDTRLNLVEQIGGYTDQKRIGAEVETRRLKFLRLRFAGDYSNIDLLNVSGDTRSKMVSYSAQAEHRIFTATYTRSFMDGAGALFPLGLIDRQFLVIPLPISQLLATPLLNRRTQVQSLMVMARPRRRLEAAIAWRTEDTQLSPSDQSYDVLQADARYHLGRFTLEGGYSRNLNDVIAITGRNGNRLAIWYFRIGRDFRIL